MALLTVRLYQRSLLATNRGMCFTVNMPGSKYFLYTLVPKSEFMLTATLKLNLIAWGFGLAIVTFIVSTATVAYLVVTLPADYFTKERESRGTRHPVLRVILLILKNLLGLVITLAGIFMLFSPGQGVLTIVIGLMLLDFPGKRKLELKLIRYPNVLNPINQLRKRFGKPPLIFDESSPQKENGHHQD